MTRNHITRAVSALLGSYRRIVRAGIVGTEFRPVHARAAVALLVALFITSYSPCALAHDELEDVKAHDLEGPYVGAGYTSGGGGSPSISFPSSGVNLEAWFTLGDLSAELTGTATNGNDVWGYVSPMNREYAVIGTNIGTVVVEVTDPGNSTIIGGITHGSSLWRDVKTYDEYAYVVTENTNFGLQVIDLTDVDNGNITLNPKIGNGKSHNVVVDEDRGLVYRVGAADGTVAGSEQGFVVYDASVSPGSPTLIGGWGDRYIHDAQAVSYDSGLYAGKSIVYAAAENNSGGGSAALDILDVTDFVASNGIDPVVLVDRLFYSDNNYSHQVWLSPDRQYLYLGDELDERNDPQVTTSTTHVFEVSDPWNASLLSTFSNGNSAIDHNQYTVEHLLFQANYRSGLRVFDASTPTAPTEIAYFDTYVENDGAHFNGLWSNYPMLPSGTVLGSDIEKGLFVWEVPALTAALSLPEPSTALLLTIGLCLTATRPPRRRRALKNF